MAALPCDSTVHGPRSARAKPNAAIFWQDTIRAQTAPREWTEARAIMHRSHGQRLPMVCEGRPYWRVAFALLEVQAWRS